MSIDAKAISQLQLFIKGCQMTPQILHDPKLSFFTEYLLSLGATIPPLPEKKQEAPKEEAPKEEARKPEPSKIPTPEPTPEPEPMEPTPEPEPMEPTPEPEPMDDSSEDEVVEVDNTGVIAGEDLLDLPMGDPDKCCSEEDMDRANAIRGEAMGIMSEGNLDEAIRLFGDAVDCNPHHAVLFAKRAQVLLRQKKPNNVVRDAEKALSLNPNNALAHKCKGKALRLLGMWEESALALAAGQKCDYDDDTQELLKRVVQPNAEKLRGARLRKESYKREKEHKAKIERARSAREARQKAYTEAKAREAESGGMPGGMGGMPGGMGGMPGGMGGMPGGMGGMPGGMGGIFDDPEIATLLQDPEVVQAMADIQQNPQNLMQYMSNPKVMKVMQKLQGKFAGMGGMPGGMGGMPGDMPGGMGDMPGGMGGMPSGFPGGMAGARQNFTEPPRSPDNANTSVPPPPPFTASCDDVD